MVKVVNSLLGVFLVMNAIIVSGSVAVVDASSLGWPSWLTVEGRKSPAEIRKQKINL